MDIKLIRQWNPKWKLTRFPPHKKCAHKKKSTQDNAHMHRWNKFQSPLCCSRTKDEHVFQVYTA